MFLVRKSFKDFDYLCFLFFLLELLSLDLDFDFDFFSYEESILTSLVIDLIFLAFIKLSLFVFIEIISITAIRLLNLTIILFWSYSNALAVSLFLHNTWWIYLFILILINRNISSFRMLECIYSNFR